MKKLSMDALQRKSPVQFREAEKIPVVVLLDNVRSMHNVGSVFRTCDAFLIEKICLCGFTPVPPHRDINKTALGATETVCWEYFADAAACITALRRAGYIPVAIEQTDTGIALPQFKADTGKKMVLVLGNEVEGVQDDVLALCDTAIEIPQMGVKHSLNVSVAAGIVLYEIAMQYHFAEG